MEGRKGAFMDPSCDLESLKVCLDAMGIGADGYFPSKTPVVGQTRPVGHSWGPGVAA